MFWNGERWLPERPQPTARAEPPARRARDWAATAIIAFAVMAVVFPFAGTGAVDKSSGTQLARSSSTSGSTSNMAVVQESSRQIKYRGGWRTADDPSYMGGHARETDAAAAQASLRFTGLAVSWIGPVGPTRGKANVVVDGKVVATVDTWASAFEPSRVLFNKAWANAGTHRIAIVASGTGNHPTVSLDAFLVGTAPSGPPPGETPAPTGGAGPTNPPNEPPAPTVAPTDAPTAAPTAAPTVAPTPRPTAAPTEPPPPPPPPPPASRPFAPPVTSGTYTVPSSIDDTGATDVSTALNNWIDRTVPDGSVISFPAAGTFLLSEGIKLGNRSNLVFRGNGAHLRLSGSGSNHRASAFVIGWSYRLGYWTGGNAHIAISNFVITGNDPTPGTFGGGENQQAVRCSGSTFIETANLTVRAVYGDGFFIDACNDVWLHDNHVVSAGRNGVSVIEGLRILAEDSDYDKVGYVTFDDEPNLSTEASRYVTFRNNRAGTWGLDFVSIDGAHKGAPIRNITITGNITTGKALSCQIDNGGGFRMTDIVFSGNSSAVPASGPRLHFAHIDGLTVTVNVQPLTSGQLASILDSTGVRYP
jgi:hypothetical protein